MSFTPIVSTYILIGLLVAFAGLLAWLIVLQIRFNRLHRRYQQLMTGVDNANLETVLDTFLAQVNEHVQTVQELKVQARTLDRTLKHSMQWMGLVRYNPFRDTGGNQSFAWAIVDGHGNGIVLSSLHSREGTRVYAKPLNKWESPHSLTDEEKQAIARAYQQQG